MLFAPITGAMKTPPVRALANSSRHIRTLLRAARGKGDAGCDYADLITNAGLRPRPARLDLPAGTWWTRVTTTLSERICALRPTATRCSGTTTHTTFSGATLNLLNSSTAAFSVRSLSSTASSTPACRWARHLRSAVGQSRTHHSGRTARRRRPNDNECVRHRAADSDTGPMICACFGVGRDTVEDAVKSGAMAERGGYRPRATGRQ